ncbi:uncharacterized protein LOC142301440 [Anomaloglossus baeobatrachus]|uniref:uncharacterized protein LOC142301440 n=1 Tax=Anomaloglossus baeobatrachus TaxID=238106 RepID=UPI003F4F4CF6
MSSTMLKTGPLYFYDQLKTKSIKRTKKVPEELPSDMKYMNINPRLASFINSLNKNKKGVTSQAEKKAEASSKEDKLHKEKYAVLPEIGAPSFVKNGEEFHNQKLNQGIYDEDPFMNPFEDYKYIAPTLLYELGKLLHFFSQYEIVFPQGVVNVLNYSWLELIEGAVYPKKPCQPLASKKAADMISQFGAEENDHKTPGNVESGDNIKSNKNKANTTLMEGTKDKAGQDFSHTKPAGNKSPQNAAAHLPVTISFSMSSRVCEDKGWISQTNESKSEDMEWKGLISWALERLQLAQIQINKQLLLLNEKGFCKPVILRHYESTKKDPTKQKKHVKPPTVILTNGKPHIPDIIRESSSLRKLHYALIDGSAMVYYPSGHLAVCHSHSGLPCGGFYTNIFSPEQSILGTFTPFGHGSIHSPESNVFLLQYNQDRGILTNKEGDKIKEWDWPKKGKLSNPFTVQVNEHVSVKVASQYAISLTFRWQQEIVRLSLSPILDVPPPQTEDLGQLMTSENFSSKTAREMAKANKKKAKEKDTKRSPKKTTILSELAKTLVIPEDHISPSNDFNAAVELRKLQRKIRNIVDDWMEHYRLAAGIDSPHIQKMSDAPPKMSSKRKVQSAAVFPITSPALKSQPVTETDVESALQKENALLYGRFLSAPAHSHTMRWDTSISTASPRPSSLSSTKREQSAAAADLNLSTNVNELNVNKSGSHAVILTGPSVSLEQDPEKIWHMSHYTCPVVLQNVMLGDKSCICRCSSHQVPYVTDLEFDQLINKTSSLDQNIVVCVVSSLGYEKTDSKDVLDQLYEKKNRYRSMPCMQSRVDSFRLLKYDINTCNIVTGHRQPLLVQRHNVAPGMILMYIRGKLMFANYIFNGYSRSIKDLQKQIIKTRSDYQTGCYLPKDFKFRLLH